MSATNAADAFKIFVEEMERRMGDPNVSNATDSGYKEPILEESIREEILSEAQKIVMGNRETAYGKPEDCFTDIAKLWDAYLNCALPKKRLDKLTIDPVDVAVMMILLKIGRMINGQPKLDNWIDIAGYAACGGEIQLD